MSLILDALKKSEAARKNRPAEPSATDSFDDEAGNRRPWRVIALSLLLLVLLGGLGAVKFLQNDTLPTDVVAEAHPDQETKLIEPVARANPQGPTKVTEEKTAQPTEADKPVKPAAPKTPPANIAAHVTPQAVTPPTSPNATPGTPPVAAPSTPIPVASPVDAKASPNITADTQSRLNPPNQNSTPAPGPAAPIPSNRPEPSLSNAGAEPPLPQSAAPTLAKSAPPTLANSTLPAPPKATPSSPTPGVSTQAPVPNTPTQSSVPEKPAAKTIAEPSKPDAIETLRPVEIVTNEIAPRFTPPRKPIVPPRSTAPADPLLARRHLQQAAELERAGKLDLAIEEYGKAIVADSQNADTYYSRGWAHEANRAFETAIGDFSQAITLRTEFTDAYFGRAWSYEQSDNISAAIADYSRVIRLDPNHMNARLSRGILRLYNGKVDLAGKDFRTVFDQADATLSDYGLLWMYASQIYHHTDPTTVANKLSSLRPRTEWPGILFRTFTGETTAADAIRSMQTSDPLTTRKRQCVGYFFLGQHRLALGDKVQAKDYFSKVLDSGITSYRQYWAAKIELKRLSVTQ